MTNSRVRLVAMFVVCGAGQKTAFPVTWKKSVLVANRTRAVQT